MPTHSPIIPELLAGDATIKFLCFEGISRLNAYCQNRDMLKSAPYD